MTAPPVVLDERSRAPFRARAGALLTAASRADFAVARIRLAALDLTVEEVTAVRRCRVLLGQLDAATLLDTAEVVPTGAAERLGVLRSFILSGRLEVRAAGLGSWTPDFSVFRGAAGQAALLGAHYFGAPYAIVGPSFTLELQDPVSVRLIGGRFEELWEGGHDVLPAIGDVVERAHALALDVGGGRGRPDRPVPLR